MNFNSKRSVTDEQNERHKRLLATILKEEGNKSCADCRTRNPTWASVNLGVFVCLTCSGIHRSLGVHISQVRSCNLDTWLPKQVEFCRVMGNLKGNRYWEARLPKDFRRPPSGNPNPELASFIRAKYVDRAYAATDAQPPTIDNYADHPYAAEDESSRSAAAAPAPPQAAGAAPQAPSGQPLRLTPTKASASSPALMVDLLGGFDDAPSHSASALPASPVPANSDPFGFGSFVSAPAPVPAPAACAIQQRNSLEWSDFAVAPAPPAAPQPANAAQQLLHTQTSLSGHHRSYSISEGVLTPTSSATASGAASQTTRFGQAALAPQDPHGGRQLLSQPQHSRTQSHPASQSHPTNHCLDSASVQHPPQSQLQNGGLHGHHGQQARYPAVAAGDPFANLAPHPSTAAAAPAPAPDDLLAGLTIHHIMESMSSPNPHPNTSNPNPNTHDGSRNGPTSAATANGAAAHAPAQPSSAAADPFSFSSSASFGDNKPLSRGSGHHRRHPSGVKSSEEILRLFDTEPSTGQKAGLGGSGPGSGAGAEDPFGDFLGAGAGARAPVVSLPVGAGVQQAENGGGAHHQANGVGAAAKQQRSAQGALDAAAFGIAASSAAVPNLL